MSTEVDAHLEVGLHLVDERHLLARQPAGAHRQRVQVGAQERDPLGVPARCPATRADSCAACRASSAGSGRGSAATCSRSAGSRCRRRRIRRPPGRTAAPATGTRRPDPCRGTLRGGPVAPFSATRAPVSRERFESSGDRCSSRASRHGRAWSARSRQVPKRRCRAA